MHKFDFKPLIYEIPSKWRTVERSWKVRDMFFTGFLIFRPTVVAVEVNCILLSGGEQEPTYQINFPTFPEAEILLNPAHIIKPHSQHLDSQMALPPKSFPSIIVLITPGERKKLLSPSYTYFSLFPPSSYVFLSFRSTYFISIIWSCFSLLSVLYFLCPASYFIKIRVRRRHYMRRHAYGNSWMRAQFCSFCKVAVTVV